MAPRENEKRTQVSRKLFLDREMEEHQQDGKRFQVRLINSLFSKETASFTVRFSVALVCSDEGTRLKYQVLHLIMKD